LGLEQAEDVLDERGLSRAVFADEAQHRAGGEREAHVVEREFRAEPPGDIAHLDDGIRRVPVLVIPWR
jgi:hypothetical protein